MGWRVEVETIIKLAGLAVTVLGMIISAMAKILWDHRGRIVKIETEIRGIESDVDEIKGSIVQINIDIQDIPKKTGDYVINAIRK